MSSSLIPNRDFRKLWFGQTISLFGSLVSRLALPFLVIYTLSATPMQVAWLRVAEMAPGILLGLWAGVGVDRWRRRHVMLITDGARAVIVGAIPILFLTHHLSLGAIMGLAILLSIASVAFDSAYDAYLPTLVRPKQLVEANSKLSAGASVAEVTGFALAGALFNWVGGALTMTIDAASFVISAASLWLIRRPEPLPAPHAYAGRAPGDLVEGLTLLAKTRSLSRLAFLAAVQSVYFGLSSAVYLLYISRSLHVAPLLQGILYAVGGAASLATAIVAERILTRVSPRQGLFAATLFGAAGTALLPLAFGPIWLIAVFITGQQVLGDGGDTLLDVSMASLRQSVAPNAYLGRIRSAWLVVTGIGTLGGALAGGLLAGAIGLRSTLFLGVGIRLAMVGLTIIIRTWSPPSSPTITPMEP